MKIKKDNEEDEKVSFTSVLEYLVIVAVIDEEIKVFLSKRLGIKME